MKTTPLRGYPVPECNPPLVKDASDIIHLKNLAEAFDQDIESLTEDSRPMLYPVGSKMSRTGLVSSLAEFTVDYTTNSWQTRVGMNNTAINRIVIPETGFYQVHAWASVASTSTLQMRTRLIVNDVPRGTWGSYSAPVAGLASQSTTHDVSLFLNAGDELTSVIRRTTTTSLTFAASLHVWQLAQS